MGSTISQKHKASSDTSASSPIMGKDITITMHSPLGERMGGAIGRDGIAFYISQKDQALHYQFQLYATKNFTEQQTL